MSAPLPGIEDAPAPPPTPVVHLFAGEVVTDTGAELREDTQAPLIELGFDYGGRRVPPVDCGRVALHRVMRDPRSESSARHVLERFGAVDLECLERVGISPDVAADYLVRCDGDLHSYCEFTRYVVPQLRAMGWIVDIDADYPFQLAATAPWYADVRPGGDGDGERPDWFGLELGVEVDGQRVNLLPALVELLDDTGRQSLAALTRGSVRELAIRVTDTHCVTLPADRVRALVRVLVELYDEHGVPRLTEANAGALSRLQDAFAEHGSHIELCGEPAVVERAARIRRVRSVPVPAPAGVRATLRPYQEQGLGWLQHLRAHGSGGILADDMGLGKTLQTIAHLSLEKAEGRLRKPALIVAPTSLVGVWEKEIAKFAPHLRTAVLYGQKRAQTWERVNRCNVAITSYSLLVRDRERFEATEFYLVVLDEAQTIKNRRSQVHQAAAALVSEHRLCLTGTPLENNLGELWTLFDFVSPGLLGTAERFRGWYRQPIEREGDTERLASLRETVAPYILRRLKSEVASELPPKTDLHRPVTLRGDQLELYEAIRLSAHSRVRSLIRQRGLAACTVSVLDALMKLRQVCCDPRLVSMDAARKVRQSAKYDALFELLDTSIAEGHRVLVFSQFTSMLGLISSGLERRGVRHSMLTGGTRGRQRIIDEFESGIGEVFLISLKAGGTGLTLTSADTIVHYDPWWNPAAQDQATDRAYRIGQTRPVFAYNLFVAGSVEERMLGLQKKKRALASAILGGPGGGLSLTEDDVDNLFAPLGAE